MTKRGLAWTRISPCERHLLFWIRRQGRIAVQQSMRFTDDSALLETNTRYSVPHPAQAGRVTAATRVPGARSLSLVGFSAVCAVPYDASGNEA